MSLPPLPEPQKECWIGHTLFSADQMHAYAAAAVEAEREAICDLVAFHGGSVEIEATIRARSKAPAT